MTIRVLLADDQVLVRAGLKVLVDSAPDLEVVGEAATGREAVTLAREARADVVLMDIRMPEMDGLAATREIMADDDLAGVRVLVLTTFEVDEYVFQALRAGASGFLGKGAEPGDLLDAIRLVARGEALLSPIATQGLITRFLSQPDRQPAPTPEKLSVLTDRERHRGVQRRHRRGPGGQPAHREDPCEPGAAEAGRQGPGPTGRPRL
jgi:DNA-binding NarL/FixJ family response regulator